MTHLHHFAILKHMNPFIAIRQYMKDFFDTHKNLLAPVILLGGFVGDWFTLSRIDQIFDNIIFIVHLLLSGLAIIFLHATDDEYMIDHPKREKFRTWAWGGMLFSFGALYSGFFIFYLRSSSLVTSWAVVIGLLAIMLSTEWKRDFYTHRTVQIGIYYFALLCYSIFLVPILTRQISAGMFILSTVLSLVVGGLFVYLLWFLDEDGIEVRRPRIIVAIIGTAVIMNFLYFMNIIPPIPLSLQYKAPYVSMYKQETSQGLSYIGGYETAPWYDLMHKRSRVLPWRAGNNLYVFAAVFAPTDIHTQIRHCWEYFDTDMHAWLPTTCIPITIVGGRDGGYRGFSQKGNLWQGKWRVRFLTKRDQSLGVLRFKIVDGRPDADKLRYDTL